MEPHSPESQSNRENRVYVLLEPEARQIIERYGCMRWLSMSFRILALVLIIALPFFLWKVKSLGGQFVFRYGMGGIVVLAQFLVAAQVFDWMVDVEANLRAPRRIRAIMED